MIAHRVADVASRRSQHFVGCLRLSDRLILSGPPELVSFFKKCFASRQMLAKQAREVVSVLQAILVRRSIRFNISSCASLLLHSEELYVPQLPLIWLFDYAARAALLLWFIETFLALVTP